MTFSDDLRFFWDFYRKMDKPTRSVWSQLKVGSVFVDVGANVGAVSRAAAARGCEVHAIEPNPWAFKSLANTVPRRGKIHFYNFAATKYAAPVELFLHETHEANPELYSSGSSLLDSKPNVTSRKVEVEGKDLAEFLRNLSRVDFLKIDIEGYEVELVPNLVSRLDWNQIGFVAVETHDKSKWESISPLTLAMKSCVDEAGLSAKFSWNWP